MKKMKIYLGAFTLMLGMLCLNSCKEEFFEATNQDGSLDEFVAFTTVEDFDKGLTSCYANLQGSGAAGANWIRVPGWVSQDVVTRDETGVVLVNYMSPNNEAFQVYWLETYKTVNATNLLLDKIQSAEPGLLTADQIKSYTAQAKFLRGFAYFILARAFGDIPMPLSSYKSEQNSIGCTTNQKVFEQVTKDLTEAAVDLPEAGNYPTEDKGRVTKGAAYAYLAYAYMYLKDWPKAKKATEDLMALTKPKYKLANNPHAPFSYMFNNTPEYLAENIFEIQYLKGKEWTIWTSGGLQPNFNGSFIPAFTIPRNIGQIWDHWAGWGETIISKKAMDSFETGDLRVKGTAEPGNNISKATYVRWGDEYRGESFPRTLLRANWGGNVQTNSGFTTKYWLGLYARGLDLYPQSLPQMRFAEVVLNYAEILFKSNMVSQAYTQLNLVRARALLAPLPESTDEATFMQSLMDERRHEFLLETNLWHQYTRTGLAAKFLQDNYQITMRPEWKYFPIPIRERTLNPNLCANGY